MSTPWKSPFQNDVHQWYTRHIYSLGSLQGSLMSMDSGPNSSCSVCTLPLEFFGHLTRGHLLTPCCTHAGHRRPGLAAERSQVPSGPLGAGSRF